MRKSRKRSLSIRRLLMVAASWFMRTSSLPLLLDRHLRSILQLAADGGVAAGDDFVADLDAVLDLDEGRIGDSGLNLLLTDGVAVLDEDDAHELLAVLALLLLLERLVTHFGFVVVV